MNDLTPYERFLASKLQNLPLPDEDMAWKEMQKLLDEDKDDRPLVAAWMKGCLPWLIGALLLGIGALVWYNWTNTHEPTTGVAKQGESSQPVGHDQDTTSSLPVTVSEPSKDDQLKESEEHGGRFDSEPPVNAGLENNAIQGTSPGDNPLNGSVKQGASGQSKTLSKKGGSANSAGDRSRKERRSDTGNTSRSRSVAGKVSAKVTSPTSGEDEAQIETKGSSATKGKTKSKDLQAEVDINRNLAKQENVKIDADEMDSIPELSGIIPNTVDSAHDHLPKMPEDTVKVIDTASNDVLQVVDSTEKSKSKKRTPFRYAAGIAVNQSIPLDGEKPVPYDYFGRKSSLGDYIPSIYFRAMKPRWFIQSEFRYGAPNLVKEFVYSKKTSIDTFQNISTSSKTLKKTFYHQIPLTFHYFITKNWSLGVGIAYNKFTRAVRQEDVRLGLPGTIRDSLISSNIVQDGKDSAFVSNSFQWIVETQYRWKRFSLGLRFAQGLEPYIKYTDPESGLPAEKRNQSLNAFLRYDLWRSKKK